MEPDYFIVKPIVFLKQLHEDLTFLEGAIKGAGLPETVDSDKVRSVYDVQEIIEGMIQDEKRRQKIITGK